MRVNEGLKNLMAQDALHETNPPASAVFLSTYLLRSQTIDFNGMFLLT